jgi:glycosyltransferase involved in cell wall biosynthesis
MQFDPTKEAQSRDRISLVVPIFNEAGNIRRLYERAGSVLGSLGVSWEFICVNDGSLDHTLTELIALSEGRQNVRIVDLSKNFGKEIAISAGVDYAFGDAVACIDADLQHPPEVLSELIGKWRDGYEVVFAVRKNRSTDSAVRRWTSSCFYRLLGCLTNVANHKRISDFCLLDRCVVDVLRQVPEQNRFMKGLFSWVGFKQGFVSYDAESRHAGKSKWSYWKLWNFAIDGITSFTTIPLRIWTYIGFGISSLCLLYAFFIVIRTIIFGIGVPGYASLIVSILFMGGIQLISLGIIGEYIGRIYHEVKRRPLYIVKSLYGFEDRETEEGKLRLTKRTAPPHSLLRRGQGWF